MALDYEDILNSVPAHLRQYVTDQHYEHYTAQDQAVWRYIMRKNLKFLSQHAHPVYIKGLQKTGISIERIPDITEMNTSLAKIGWRAVVVSGFIPPAAFMEFQANKILVISAEMRTFSHILYTPAPDIVHEAAGHAPIIADAEYSAYLQKFGEYGSMAMSSKADFEIYEAIRYLSIIKEYPHATAEQIKQAEDDLNQKLAAYSEPSEAAKISRLHWWTVEYGLFGNPENFSLYGAGLLSSVGESQACLNPKVKKLPLTVDCANTNYDITSMQPQLFVTESWQQLMDVLEEFSATMCFRTGGATALKTAIESENAATAVYTSGLQVSGIFSDLITDEYGNEAYIKTTGRTSLAVRNAVLNGHGIEYHKNGFGSPVGKIHGLVKDLEDCAESDLLDAKIVTGKFVNLEFISGIKVRGNLESLLRKNGKIVLMTFTDCTVIGPKNEILFQPAWGKYDMAAGARVTSVFAGTADKEAHNVMPPKSSNTAIAVEYSEREKQLFGYYKKIREMRENKKSAPDILHQLYPILQENYKNDWLIRLEILELIVQSGNNPQFKEMLLNDLHDLQNHSDDYKNLISSGLELLGFSSSRIPSFQIMES